MSKTQQKLRRLISRLEERLREAGLGDEAIIVPHRYHCRPGYFLLLIPDQKYLDRHEPQRKAKKQ